MKGRTVATVLGAVSLALLLTGCVKVNMNLVVSEDNTVSGSMIFAVDKQLLQLTGGSVDDLLQGNLPEDLQGATVAAYEEGGFVGKEFTFDAIPLSKFSGTGPDELSIVRDGDEFIVSGQLDLSSGALGTDPGQVPPAMLDSFEFTIDVTFPGPVKSSTGKIEGNSVSFEPSFGTNNRIEAVASAIPSGGSPLLVILLAVAGVLIVAAIAFLVMRGKRPAPAAGPIEDASGGPVEEGLEPPEPAQPASPPDLPGSTATANEEMPPPPVPPVSD